MEKVVDSLIAITYFLLITAGGSYGIYQTGQWIKRAALTKAAGGLPPLPRFDKFNYN